MTRSLSTTRDLAERFGVPGHTIASLSYTLFPPDAIERDSRGWKLYDEQQVEVIRATLERRGFSLREYAAH